MTNRHVNILLLMAVLAIGAGYLWYSRLILETQGDGGVEPIMFPVLIGIGIVLLSLVELFRAMRNASPEEDERFDLPNAGKLVATLVLVAAHFLAWGWFEAFYPASAVLFVALVLLYSERITTRQVATAAAVSACFTAALYLVFQVIFGISLS